MKTIFSTALCALFSMTALAQETVPAAPAIVPMTVPVPPAGKSTLDQLKWVKEQNARLLEQQAATLKLLEELEKTAQQLKLFGKRS